MIIRQQIDFAASHSLPYHSSAPPTHVLSSFFLSSSSSPSSYSTNGQAIHINTGTKALGSWNLFLTRLQLYSVVSRPATLSLDAGGSASDLW